MNPNNVWKKNREFYIGVAGTVLEGLFSGSLFMLLYSVMRFLWDGQIDMNRVLGPDRCYCIYLSAPYFDIQLWLYQSTDRRRKSQ